jgi:exodeoxyribonuclease VII small subunit
MYALAVSDDTDALTYEAALAQLDALIQRLEAGSIPLEEAIAAYERGVRLARHCEELLDRTERRVSALVIGGDGRPVEQPLQIDPVAAPEPAPGAPRDVGEDAGGLFGRSSLRRPAQPVDPDDVPF